MSSTAIQTQTVTVADRLTGEVLDVQDATTQQLAQFVENADTVRSQMADAVEVVSAELLARLDRDASWTQRVGDPADGYQFEIAAPSPTAGTISYPSDMLEGELRTLVERGTITEDAAAKALKRQVTLVLDVPLHLPLKETADGLAQLTISLGENKLPIVKADHGAAANKTGIKALEKVPGAVAALKRARVTATVGARRVKVTRKEREA